MTARPFGGGLLLQAVPILESLKPQREQTEPESVVHGQRPEAQQVRRRGESPNPLSVEVGHVGVYPLESVLQAQLLHHSRDGCIAAKEVMVGALQGRTTHLESGCLPTQKGGLFKNEGLVTEQR